jgi:hypothetical protein
MSHKLENVFRNSLRNEEAAYDPKAWDAMTKALDKVMPTTGTSSILKWAAVSTGIVAIASAVYLQTSNNTTNKENTNTVAEQTQQSKIQQKEAITNETVQAKNIVTEELAPQKQEISQTTDINKEANVVSDLKTKNSSPVVNLNSKEETSIQEFIAEQNEPQKAAPTTPKVILPAISEKCQNEGLSLKNTNSVDLILSSPSGKMTRVKANSSATVELTESGHYSLVADHAMIDLEKQFMVNPAPIADFDQVGSVLYEQGIPTYSFKATNQGNSINWYLNDSRVAQGPDANLAIFKKGNQKVKIVSKSEVGCVTSVEKQIQIAENYNLLAPGGLAPLSTDPRNNSFMPVALRERNSDFVMMIIDPKDGGMVYQTTSSSDGWDGVDSRNGKLAVANSMYIWKVILANPLPGENGEYRGTISIQR